MTELERMRAGQLYVLQGEELLQMRRRAYRLVRAFNATTEDEPERREALLRELLGGMGKDVFIEPPFRCDYGCHIFLGSHVYFNYECIILDVGDVTLGSHVFLGPRVGLYTAGHPIDAAVRRENLEYGKPITIGDDVWIGGDTVVNPGVTIGSDVVIGSGSVVTRDIPSHVVAAGNPCRVLRPITAEDRAHWEALRAEYEASLTAPDGGGPRPGGD